jgi:DNA-binding LacI/PurR family transcriptional regulator
VSAEDHMSSLDALRSAGIPAVAIDRIPEGYDGPSVTLDNVEAGRIAADHLLDLGHTCIAHISGPLKLRLARERQKGFDEAITKRGLKVSLCVGGEGNWGCEVGYQAMLRILECNPLPTAIFADNDRMAIGAMRAIYEAGLRVPTDISAIGLDDIEVAAFQVPPLTTVRQSFSELATHAIRLLLQILASEEVSEPRITVRPTLIVRKSTGPPPE